MGFHELALRPELHAGIEQRGWTELTPIQRSALPPLLEGRDVLGQAQTGSGKTAAFGLAALNRLDTDNLRPQALVLCPTRELADQVSEELRSLAVRMPNTRVVTLCGGRPMKPQARELARGCHLVVGTPGRVLQHLTRESLVVDDIGMLVLDEADRMLDMGFVEQVSDVASQCPEGQTLLFSATFPEGILALSERVQSDAVHLRDESAVEQVQQWLYRCQTGGRNQRVAELLAHFAPERTLVFCETRADCDSMARFLSGRGARALALHGLLEQRDRDDVLVQFRHCSMSVLVATNVAARGLDIESLPAVVVAELSHDPENHVHRIGRTGRAGRSGVALTVVEPREEERLGRTEEAYGALPEGPLLTGGSGLAGLVPPNRTLLLLAGRKAKLRPGDVLGALVKELGLPASAVGRIDVAERSCAVALDRAQADAVAGRAILRIKKQNVRIRLLD